MQGLLYKLGKGGIVVKAKESSKLLNRMDNTEGEFLDKAHIEEMIRGEIEISKENHYSILLFDIKDIMSGDYDGIKAGEVLHIVEATVLSCIRREDLAAWTDENQFLILTAVTDKVQLRGILKRLYCSLIQRFFNINENPQIHIGLAVRDDNLSLQQLLSSARESMEEARLKKKSRGFEQELQLAVKIDKVRKELHRMIINQKAKGFDETIVRMSQYLDELLVEYIRNSRSENYE